MRTTATILASATAALMLVAASALPAQADAKDGKKVFNKCKSCHTLDAGKHRIGPSLAGVVGRKAGAAEGYGKYSDALLESGIVWNDETLNAYLENPKKAIPGNKMTFAGLRKAEDRAAVIEYMEQQGK